ncbi:MAG: hypothetical protein ACYCOU_23980 [Sulfobacillus sp.]
MPLIPYPRIPMFLGVPLIPRLAPYHLNIALSAPAPEGIVAALEPIWGIFDPSGNPIYAPNQGGTLSVLSFSFERGMDVLDFPVEAVAGSNQGAAFASYNKVYRPANPILTLALAGNEREKTDFLQHIDAATKSTQLYNVVTPDAAYSSPYGAYTVNQYSYRRSAVQGATLLIVEVSLIQVKQVTSTLSNIPASQSPSAAAQANGGTVSGASTTISPRLASFLNAGILHEGAQ